MNFLELMEKWGNAEPADIQISSVPEVLGQRRLEQGSDGDGGGGILFEEPESEDWRP